MLNKFVCIISKEQTHLDIENLGGKGYYLIELKKHNFSVADGFILTTKAFDKFIIENKLDERINAIIKKDIYNNKNEFQLKKIINESKIDGDIQLEIENALHTTNLSDKKLVVRSSANVEDTGKHSFAGIFDTLLNIDKSNLIKSILTIYASLYNLRASAYIDQNKIPTSEIKMAISIQEFIKTDYAGVAFTSNPINGDSDEIYIEYVKGLGEKLVSGTVEPTSIKFDKDKFKDTDPKITKNISPSLRNNLLELAKLSKKIEEVFGVPMDIEWGMKNNVITIFQAREITTGNP